MAPVKQAQLPQPEAATAVEAPPTEIDLLMQKIEEMLSQAEKPPIPHLTEDVRAALAAPLDPKFLRSRKGSGGKTFTYADLDYLESRVAAVDPDWSISFNSNTQNVLVCMVVIHSVPRSAVAGYYIPDEYEVWDNNAKHMVPRRMTAEVSHTVVTRAQAAAERRAFAMFGLGAELWLHNQESAEDFLPSNESTQRQQSPRGEPKGQEGFREPSEARIKLLVDMGVPEAVAKGINSWSTGKDANNKPISDVGDVINALFKARGQDKGPVDRRTWERIVGEHAPYALTSSGGSTNDGDDNDFDF